MSAREVAELAMKLGLLTRDQAEEIFAELGSKTGKDSEFLLCGERKGHLTPYQSRRLIGGETDGYFLGGYRILYKIASGTFGRVYRAVDASGRVVAIKVLRKKWSEDKHKIELFMREGKVGMTLRHPNIVEIISVNHEKKTNQYYIVMDFVEGGNMRDFLNIRKKLEADQSLRIVEDTAQALTYALSKGITHRDMKLTNILLSSAGPAKLVDFGLAGGHFGMDDKEEGVTVDRTVDYAGLEKTSGAPHGDPRSDLYFLGCITYELLTGRSPLSQKRGQARMSADRFMKVDPMRSDEVNAPLSVFRLVETMMILDPDQRFQTPSQLLEQIRECRAEISGKKANQASNKPALPTIFLVEKEEALQDVLRAKLKEHGYRILIAADPIRALDRFRQQPFDLLIVNVGTTGEDGFYVFERIIDDARRQELRCQGILMLESDQSSFEEKISDLTGVVALTQPIKFKQLLRTIQTMLPSPNAPPAAAEPAPEGA